MTGSISRDPTSNAEKYFHRINPPMSLVHEIFFVFILSTSQLMTQAGLGQTIAPLHIVGKSLGTTNEAQLSWFPASFSLTVGTFILIAGRIGDIYGHKAMFVYGYAWYSIWSLVSGFSVYSKSPIMFDVCRALTGIAPAVLLPNGLAILGRAYQPGRRKQAVFCFFGATAPSGYLLGAVFSSIFAQLSWWPWAYWSTSIICCAFCLAGFLIIPNAKDGNKDIDEINHKEKKRFDYAGSFFGVAGLILINFAWNQAPVVGWHVPYVYVLLIIGFLCFFIFLYIERKVTQPILPPDIFTEEIGLVLLCVAAGWCCYTIWIYYFWNFLEVLRNQSPLLTSGQWSPVSVTGTLAAAITGIILSWVRPIFVMIISMVFFTAGSILIATAPINQTYWAQTFVSIVITPFGMDMSFPAATLTISDYVSKENQGIAASLVSTIVNYSISIGLGIAGTVENRLNHEGTDILRGYRSAWYLGIGFGGLGILISSISAIYIYTKSKRIR